MIEELKEIRKRLDDAVSIQDWWIVKSQINKIDTILYFDYQGKVENLSLSDVIKSVCNICKHPLTKEEKQTGHCFNCGEQDI